MGEYVKVSELVGPDLANGFGDKNWLLEPWAFRPDAWTSAFLRGLRNLQPSEGMWEVGVGTGLVTFFLRNWFPLEQTYYSDFDHRCTELAMINLLEGPHATPGLNPLHGSWDLVTHERKKAPPVETIVGCIPQALLPSWKRLSEDDNEAHYYDAASYPESRLHHLGLGLNEALLIRARKEVLRSGGKVVLNLAGRPRLDCLLQMFRDNGYLPEILHNEVVAQHQPTSLVGFANMEAKGARFEFFADREAKEPINADQAEDLRADYQAVFHYVYVIEGTMV